MSKFTPGPWGDNGWNGAGGRHISRQGGDWMHVADVPAWRDTPYHAMGLTNARLIAAAPEMYELLRTAMPSQSASAIDAEKWRLKRRALLARIDGESDD